jgi:hypothetical protein
MSLMSILSYTYPHGVRNEGFGIGMHGQYILMYPKVQHTSVIARNWQNGPSVPNVWAKAVWRFSAMPVIFHLHAPRRNQ